MEMSYKIPLRYEEGTYKLKELMAHVFEDTDEYMTIVYDEEHEIVENSVNDIRIYSFKEDISENIIVVYRSPYAYFQQGKGNNLEMVYALSDTGMEQPFFWDIGEKIFSRRISDVFEKVQECIVKYADGLVKGLEEAPLPLAPMVLEYYFEGTDTNINIIGAYDEIIYDAVSADASYTVECIIKSAPKEKAGEIFYALLMGIYNRLCYEIPKKYELKEDYQLFLPERYD